MPFAKHQVTSLPLGWFSGVPFSLSKSPIQAAKLKRSVAGLLKTSLAFALIGGFDWWLGAWGVGSDLPSTRTRGSSPNHQDEQTIQRYVKHVTRKFKQSAWKAAKGCPQIRLRQMCRAQQLTPLPSDTQDICFRGQTTTSLHLASTYATPAAGGHIKWALGHIRHEF